MRIEDLDSPRTKAGAEAQALEDLRWLGLDFDGGPERDGHQAPYRQSERTPLYRSAIDRLVSRGLAYPCVCTRSEIEGAASAPQAGDHETRYPGTCRGRFAGLEAAERASGRPAALRFVVRPGPVAFHDGFHGSVTFDPSAECGDFVIEKVERSGPKFGTRTAAYQLACVVDDAAMGVTEVCRGDDLLSSTARQLLIQDALGLVSPGYVHVPILVGTDGRRLAKRHGDTTIRRFREAGVPAPRVVGWLAAVSGLADPGAHVHPAELLQKFDWQRVPRVPVVVSPRIVDELLHS
jgi:glutamyl-tRNA synthetase